MSGTSAHLRACMSAWLSDELRAPDLALRLVLRRRARDFGAESGPREYLEAFALKALASAPKDTSSAETLEPLLQDAIAWALEAAEITRDVQQPSSSQKDFGVESLVMLGRVVQEAFRLGAADDERVAHALWWKLHLLADTDRSRFWHWKGRVREVRPGLSREAAHARRDALRGQLEPWCLRASEALHAALVPSMDRLRTRLAASGYDNAEHGARGEHSVVARGHRDAPAPHVLLEVPDPISKRSGKVSSWAIRNSYPDAVANHLAYLLARGALPNDLILLMPPDAPAHAWADYARALTRAGIPFSAPWGPAWQEMLVVREIGRAHV